MHTLFLQTNTSFAKYNTLKQLNNQLCIVPWFVLTAPDIYYFFSLLYDKMLRRSYFFGHWVKGKKDKTCTFLTSVSDRFFSLSTLHETNILKLLFDFPSEPVAQRKFFFFLYYFLHRTVHTIEHRVGISSGDVTGTTPLQRLLLLAILSKTEMLEKYR